jgi:hypothetical protein
MMIKDEFGLRDEEYWTDPWRTRSDIQRPLLQKSLETFLIGAPQTVALNTYSTFPVAILRTRKLISTSKVDFRRAAIITAIELNTYRLSARQAFANSPQPSVRNSVPRSGAKDSFANDTSAMAAEGSTIDLARLLGLPASRSAYLITLICLDKVSNRCGMKLVEAAGYEDPAVDEFLRQHLASRQAPPLIFPEPTETLPSYRREAASPAIPTEPGITLSVTRVNVFTPAARCVLSGSYRLPIQPQHAVKPAEFGNGEVTTPAATAIVPITLLLTGSVEPEPKVLRLSVPSYEPLQSAGDQEVAVGHFSLDLCRMANLLVTPQTFFIYAFSGEVMTAGVPTAFARLPEEHLNAVQSW